MGGKAKDFYIHTLVANAFVPNNENKQQVNHKDGDQGNNHYKNLEWVTPSENTQHAYDNGFANAVSGDAHYKRKNKSSR